MTEIGFYHLTGTPLERALPKLLEKALSQGLRAVVLAGSEERVAALDTALWTYEQLSFLPHGTARDGEAAAQPIYLTTEDENPNAARLLVLTDGATSARIDTFERCIDLFDGGDPDAVTSARERWRTLKAAGHSLAYWQQTDRGGWEKKEA